MAVPTIDTIAPTEGAPTGGQVIEINGTNFQMPPAPPAEGVVPIPAPTVRVTFAGVAAPVVAVVSETRLFVRVPRISMPVVSGLTQGSLAADVVVENIDTDGVLIPGETVTLAGGYTYQRPRLGTAAESSLASVVRQLLRRLKSEVIGEVILSMHTDYDRDTGTIATDVAVVPAMVLVGPTLTKNTIFTENAPTTNIFGNDEFGERRRAIYFDVGFDVILITQSDVQLLNLMELTTTVIDRSSAFQFSSPALPAGFQLNLEWTDGLAVSKQTNQLNSNVRVAEGTFTIIGLPFNTLIGSTRDAIQEVGAALAGSPSLQTPQNFGDT